MTTLATSGPGGDSAGQCVQVLLGKTMKYS